LNGKRRAKIPFKSTMVPKLDLAHFGFGQLFKTGPFTVNSKNLDKLLKRRKTNE
jgi:hypothetical protein